MATSFGGSGGGFLPGKFQSKSIYLDTNTVIKATILTVTTVGNVIFYLSANGGTNWETVTVGTEHTFTNTGNDLRYMAIGDNGATLSEIKVSYTLS